MIDFRYHLVSLVSVFLALAVGVVLGAGPLRGQIADSLNSSVEQLREEKNQLRSDLTVAEAGVKNRDTFTAELVPTLVAGRLAGRSVVVVRLPDADGDLVEPLTGALRAAGAAVPAVVELKAAWTSADKASARRELAQQWGGQGGQASIPSATPSSSRPANGSPSPVPPGRGGEDVEATLADLLGRALLTTDPGQVGKADPVGGQILDALAGEGLLEVSGELTGRAGLVVLLAPGVDAVLADAPSPTPSASPLSAPVWAALSLRLDDSGGGAVLLGPASAAATTSGVLAAVRDDSAIAERVSTVDTAGTPMGDVTTVMALREQLAAGTGAYGFGKGAGRPLPEFVTAGQ